ncbi:dynein regulatory complex protein 10 [Stegastes partitus]|uniref:Dynein regulatory complex protein 10 n=1 Tax=Stegastes partitus TaxID=144197 RepID=A0A3B5ASP0_9TELE|nr:PREDICTED: IQ domain-containing protein D [Stegastes partitus]
MAAKWATGPATTQSDDALLLLYPEAEHISNVLESCISQAEIAAILSAVLKSNSVSGIEDQELRKALQEHQILEERLEGQAMEASDQAREQLEWNFKKSFRGALRLCQANPGAISGLRAELGIEIEESENILIRELKMFHSNMVKRLLTNLDKEPQSPEEIILLEKRLAEKIKEIDKQVAFKENEIENMQNDLQMCKAVEEEEMSLLTDKQCQPQVKTTSLKQTRLQQEIDQLNDQLYNLMLKRRQAERILQEKNEEVEMKIETLIQSFDAKMEETQANLDVNETGYRKEEEELRKLEKEFSVLEVECNQILERRRQAEEKRREEMKELELKTKAAIFAQAWWRGYSTRKALKNKGKGKKAKKSKGKKSK